MAVSAYKALAWAEQRLGLLANPAYNEGDGRSAIGDAVQEIQEKAGGGSYTETITTVAGQSEYSMPSSVSVIHDIEWPSVWKYATIRWMDEETFRNLRRQIANSEISSLASQPEYWAFWQNSADGKGVFALEKASTIVAGLSINVKCVKSTNIQQPILDDSYGGSGGQEPTVELSDSQTLMLKYAIAWKLSEIYAQDKVQYYENQFLAHVSSWWSRNAFATDKTVVAEQYHLIG